MDTDNSPRSLATTIGFLPGDVLLEVFDLFRIEETTTSGHLPWKWQSLAHVCRTWRDIILASSYRLNLELFCTYGTPVRKTLRHLPPLPIVIHFPDSPLEATKEDNVNILAALEHPDRVRCIKLYLPDSSLGDVITVMQRPFPALTHLWLSSKDIGRTLVIPDSFLDGCAPRLQEIYLDGVPFPTVPTLFSSACNLVDIHFYHIDDTGSISPETMAASLAALSRLKRLTFRFQLEGSWIGERSQPPITRSVLPALTTFSFGGTVEYLEGFAAHIDAPQLNFVTIEYLDSTRYLNSPIPQLCGFIHRSEKLSQFRRLVLELEPFTFIVQLDGGRSSLKLSIQFRGLSGLLSQICGMFPNVESLFVDSTYLQDELDDEIEWSDILPHFTAVRELRAWNYASRCISLELGRLAEYGEVAGVLPALELLELEDQQGTFVEEFVAALQDMGRPVTLIGC